MEKQIFRVESVCSGYAINCKKGLNAKEVRKALKEEGYYKVHSDLNQFKQFRCTEYKYGHNPVIEDRWYLYYSNRWIF
jgi:hypothetical protein